MLLLLMMMIIVMMMVVVMMMNEEIVRVYYIPLMGFSLNLQGLKSRIALYGSKETIVPIDRNKHLYLCDVVPASCYEADSRNIFYMMMMMVKTMMIMMMVKMMMMMIIIIMMMMIL